MSFINLSTSQWWIVISLAFVVFLSFYLRGKSFSQADWNSFLNSLATRGGAIFVLLLLSVVGFAITLHIIHHGDENSMIAAGLVTTVGNFTGALLLALKGSSESTSTATVSPEGKVTAKVSTEGQGSTAETPSTASSAPPNPPVPPVEK